MIKKLKHIPLSLYYLCAFYFLFTLTNLTRLPIFNDESIYLDWAWSNTHLPGHLYDSLQDAKQPLLIWVFALFENFFADPLFAGRFVSVLVGFLTVVGIYQVTKTVLDIKQARVAAVLYTIIPLFVFYNRQALMEGSIACIGIWSFYSLYKLITKPSIKNGIYLGVILGIGFFIKSSSLLFIVSTVCILLYSLIKKRKISLLQPFIFSIITFFCVDILLFINPVFWQTFSTNNRYSLTLAELLRFPFSTWLANIQGFFQIGFFFLTPFVFLLSFFGLFFLFKQKQTKANLFVSYFTIALVLELLLTKSQNQRYLVAFLPFLVIPAAYIVCTLWKRNYSAKCFVALTCLIPFLCSFVLIVAPDYYIRQSSYLTRYAQREYIEGQTAGYGVSEVMSYITQHTNSNLPTLIVFGINSGNPEDALDVYAYKTKNMYPLYIDATMFPEVATYNCFSSAYPVFFVTRMDQQEGVGQFFVLAKSFPNPNNTYALNVYLLKKHCVGKTLVLPDVYQSVLHTEQKMK